MAEPEPKPVPQPQPAPIKYKATKGDAVDELMAHWINQYQLDVPLVRLDDKSVGEYRRYMFGTKKIQAKILNDKLVVKVGGGFMLITEFIETYGQQEYDKMLAMQAQNPGMPLTHVMKSPTNRGSPVNLAGRPGSGGRASPKGSMSPTGFKR